MELYEELIIDALKNERVSVIFPDLKFNAKEIVESASYNALLKIKNILTNTNLSDRECFEKIEEIVCLFEELGSNGGTRHDFG